jgi:uncharacterized protein DUF3892
MSQPSSVSAEVRFRVDRTAKEERKDGGSHRHVSRLCLSNGRQIDKVEAIDAIRAGGSTFYLLAEGTWAEVQVVERCPRCAEPYLRTSSDSSSRDALLRLPDC